MNTRVAIGIVGGLVIVALGYGISTFSQRKSAVSEPMTSSSTETGIIGSPTNLSPEQAEGKVETPKTPSKPAINVQVENIGYFDRINMVNTGGSPVITGIANTKTVDIIVIDSSGKGLAAGRDVAVEGGRWNYSPPLILPAGTYTIQLIAGTHSTQTSLTVK